MNREEGETEGQGVGKDREGGGTGIGRDRKEGG